MAICFLRKNYGHLFPEKNMHGYTRQKKDETPPMAAMFYLLEILCHGSYVRENGNAPLRHIS